MRSVLRILWNTGKRLFAPRQERLSRSHLVQMYLSRNNNLTGVKPPFASNQERCEGKFSSNRQRN
jgi:hypothetical protein